MTSRRYHPYTRPSAATSSTVSILSNAQGVAFNGNPTFHVNDRTSASTEDLLEAEGMKILHQRVATGAMHNSGERFDPPKCHPRTRVALQKDVFRWVDAPPGGRLVTWLFGPAGAGKSAIAQTISEKLHAEGKLTASFFFSRRESASQGRGDESALVATLAYQLSLSAPATRPLIARAVRENPLIFNLSLDDQVQTLIVHPLSADFQQNPDYGCPRVIVVDGLDECRKENNAQSRVVSALINGLSSISQQSQKLFITSRPEHNIVAIFRSFKPELVRKMGLNDKWKPDADIHTFLQAGFAEIRSSHPYFEDHPVDKMWPSHTVIDKLVSKSSSQFIYASVVLKYIKSDDYYDPAARLEVILQLKNNEDQPYAELDALYQYIFSQIRDVENVLTVLSLERFYSRANFKNLPGNLSVFLSYFTGAGTKEIQFWLRPLVSLLTCQGPFGFIKIQYLHASLPDFLADESRSDTFCIYSLPIATKIVQQALYRLQDNDLYKKNINFIPILLTIPRHYSEKLPLRIHIFSLLTNFNFVDSVLSQICPVPLSSPKNFLDDDLTPLVGIYLRWILAESENDPTKALVKPVSQISTWIIQHMVCKSFNQLENIEQVDLWPFFLRSAENSKVRFSMAGLRSAISENTAAALEIYGLSNLSYRVPTAEYIEVSDQTALFYRLTALIPRWLDNTALLGQYAITGERYKAVFLRISNHILRQPKEQLLAILDDYDVELPMSRDVQLSAWNTLPYCMDRLPLTMELYFFVLYMYTVIVGHIQARDRFVSTPGRSVVQYLRLVSTH